MKRLLVFFLFLGIATHSFCWGQNGHRIVGYLAQLHLTKKAKKSIGLVLNDKTLAQISTHMDLIRSNKKYDHMAPWHYCTIPDGETYESDSAPEEGDAVIAITRLIAELKSKEFTDEDEFFALACLVHLVGDIHQPLHVGNGKDRGGNDVKLQYFWGQSNLHRVWDSGIIDKQQLSFTEYTNWLNHVSRDQKKEWQRATVFDWADESASFRDQVYDLPDDKKISYGYNYKNLELVNLRLTQAGIRLAGILNEIYG